MVLEEGVGGCDREGRNVEIELAVLRMGVSGTEDVTTYVWC